MADTIEPIKKGQHYIDCVYIGPLDNGQKGFKLHTKKDIFQDVYDKNIKNLENWVAVRVNIAQHRDDVNITIIEQAS